MSIPTIGDLSQSYVSRLSMSRLGRELTTLGREVTSGLTADVAAHMNGDTAPLAAVERGLDTVSAYQTAIRETRVVAGAAQLSLERAQTRIGDVAADAMKVAGGNLSVSLDTVAAAARQGFSGMVSDLGTSAGGVRLFAGAATDGPALRPAEEIMADLAAATWDLGTADEVDAAIEAYFADGGPFDTNDYLGATQSRAPVRVGPGDAVDFAPRADATEIRAGLKALARIAVLDAGALSGNQSERMALLSSGIEDAVTAGEGLIALQARGGAVEERLELAATRAAAERSGLETARLDMIAIDPFEAATRLEQSQVQLESLYAVTARLSRMSLSDYMR